MPSLVPFDFRCVGHLTGVSLRCAPLRVCLAVQQQQQQATKALALPRDMPDKGVPESLCLTSSGGDGGSNDQSRHVPSSKEAVPTAALRCSSLSPPPLPHATTTDDSGWSSSPLSSVPENKPLRGVEGAHHHTDVVAGPSTQVCTLNFHDPSLSIEVYYTISIRPPFSSSMGGGQSNTTAAARMKYSTETTHSGVYGGGGGGSSGGDGGDCVWASEGQCAPTLVDSSAFVYTSEVASGSPHPCWSAIPPLQLKVYGAAKEIELAFYYTASCLSNALLLMASASDTKASTAKPFSGTVQADVCVYRCHVDMRDVLYAGSTIEEADATLSRVFDLEGLQPHTRFSTRPIILLRYTDGVFLPRVCLLDLSAAAVALLMDMQTARTKSFAPPPTVTDFRATPLTTTTARHTGSAHRPTATRASMTCEELPWSRAPSSVAWRCPLTAVPRVSLLRTTVGDVKAAALTTVAWQRLADLTEERQAGLAADLNRKVAANPLERAEEVRCAALRVQVLAAREQLTLSTLELEALQEQVERRQRQLARQEAAHAKLQRYQSIVTSPEAKEQLMVAARDDEVQRARLRAQLARGRQQRTRELCLLYRVELSSQYASPACTRAADAKDHINKCALPIIFPGRADADAASHLVAKTVEDMHAEAVALGHASHLLVVLSILYSCALPYPIVLGSGQSHILPSTHLSPAQVLAARFTLTEACKYPLSCHKVTDRPLMMAGVRLLMHDGAVLAKAMGKPERQVVACSDRLGALLHLLLHDVE